MRHFVHRSSCRPLEPTQGISGTDNKESYDVVCRYTVKSCSRRKESGASFSSNAISHVQRRISSRLSQWQTFLKFTPDSIHTEGSSDAFIDVIPVKVSRTYPSKLWTMEVDSWGYLIDLMDHFTISDIPQFFVGQILNKNRNLRIISMNETKIFLFKFVTFW